MEAKGLRVNAGKTKVMQCRVSRFQSEDFGKHPCGVCRKGVVSNSILCVECLRWVHKRCSSIKRKIKSNVYFRGVISQLLPTFGYFNPLIPELFVMDEKIISTT